MSWFLSMFDERTKMLNELSAEKGLTVMELKQYDKDLMNINRGNNEYELEELCDKLELKECYPDILDNYPENEDMDGWYYVDNYGRNWIKSVLITSQESIKAQIDELKRIRNEKWEKRKQLYTKYDFTTEEINRLIYTGRMIYRSHTNFATETIADAFKDYNTPIVEIQRSTIFG